MLIRNKINSFLKIFEKKLLTLNLIELNQKNLLSNYDFFQRRNPDKQIWPVIKSNAYGHGIQQVAAILKKRTFAYLVADSYYEALKVREVSKQPVLLIGPNLPQNIPFMEYTNLAVTVYNFETLKNLAQIQKKIKIHLKINTGMNRQGIEPAEIPIYLKEIKRYPMLELEGVWTHLADADGKDDRYTERQKRLFFTYLKDIQDFLKLKPKYIHLANTAGSEKVKEKQANSIRLGIGLYGFNPLSKADPAYKNLEGLLPVLRFISTIVKIRKIKPGAKVSYNCTFTAEKEMKIGVLPAGYYEVFDRRLSNKGYVKYGADFLPIVGRVCMNLTLVDLQKTKAREWDKLEIISANAEDKNSVQNIANLCNTIPYEILVKINESVRRVIV